MLFGKGAFDFFYQTGNFEGGDYRFGAALMFRPEIIDDESPQKLFAVC